MKKLVFAMAVLAVLSLVGTANAAAIQGSTSWNIFGSITTVNYHTFVMPQPVAGQLSGMYANPGFGDFTVVPQDFYSNPRVMTWLSSNALDVANPAGWTFGSAEFGTWTTTGGSYNKGYGFLNASLQGIFTPGTMFVGKTASRGIMTLGFILNGNAASNVSGSMAMIPEPSSLIALLGGLGSIFAIKRRKA